MFIQMVFRNLLNEIKKICIIDIDNINQSLCRCFFFVLEGFVVIIIVEL